MTNELGMLSGLCYAALGTGPFKKFTEKVSSSKTCLPDVRKHSLSGAQ